MEYSAGKNRVLIVDDEKNIRLTLSSALESLDIRVDTAVNGEEALAKLETGDFGLILLDLKMPGMDGMEVLRLVRKKRPQIKVVIITAHGTIDSAVDAMKLGAVDFLQKPFAPREIRELVTKMLDRDRIAADKAHGYAEYIELAKKCIEQHQFDAAQEYLARAVAADATKPEALNLLGVLLEMNGNKIDAQKNYRAALALDPTYKPADANLRRSAGLESGRPFDSGQRSPKEGR
jgi:DNA-binding NtrC family response regulator